MLRDNPSVRTYQPHCHRNNAVLLPHGRGERRRFRVRIQHPCQRIERRRSAEEVQEDHDALEGDQ